MLNYCADRYARAKLNTKNKTPKTVVARIKNASNPRALLFGCPSSAPVNKLAAFPLDGCIITKIIKITEIAISAYVKISYTNVPP